ncbi:DUF2147 domain-containing protein [Bradyrhizobium sp. USDA 4353]
MKRLLAVAAVVLASSVAQAQYVIEYGGKTIRIDPDRGTVQIPGVYDNTEQKKTKRSKREQDTTAKPQPGADKPPPAPAEAAVTPSPPAQAAPATPAPAPVPPAPTTAAPATPPATPAAPAPVQAAAPPAPVPPPPAPSAPAMITPPAAVTPPAAPTAPAAVQPPTRPAQAPASVTTAAVPPAATAARDPNSPVGIWLTEEKEGKIRIEPCGTNLCGYAVNTKTNQNGEQILINMRPSDKAQDKKWSGRIYDPNSGSTYDSTIDLKGPDSLRVQGCAFGGMFCGGQTWTRVN